MSCVRMVTIVTIVMVMNLSGDSTQARMLMIGGGMMIMVMSQ